MNLHLKKFLAVIATVLTVSGHAHAGDFQKLRKLSTPSIGWTSLLQKKHGGWTSMFEGAEKLKALKKKVGEVIVPLARTKQTNLPEARKSTGGKAVKVPVSRKIPSQ